MAPGLRGLGESETPWGCVDICFECRVGLPSAGHKCPATLSESPPSLKGFASPDPCWGCTEVKLGPSSQASTSYSSKLGKVTLLWAVFASLEVIALVELCTW